MSVALLILQYAVTASFVALGLLTLQDWRRHRDNRHGFLALAIGLLAVVALLTRLGDLAAGAQRAGLVDLTIALFMASGYALLRFQDTFIPLPTRVRWPVAGLAAAVAAATILSVGGSSGGPATPFQTLAAYAFVLVWSLLVGVPIVRFWQAARGRPAVQRARLRGVAVGYAAIVVILVVAGLGGTAANDPAVQILLQLIALAVVPVLYASFVPPLWLLRAWRETEEDAFRQAFRDLLLFSSDRATLSRRALEWGVRLLGAEGGALIDGEQVLAVQGMEPSLALRLSREAGGGTQAQLVSLPGAAHQNAVVVPMPLEDMKKAAAVLVSSAFMPLFGSDEILRLEQFVVNVTAGLDRVLVTERLSELERNKSQFLNLASHELRTPLSVIRGYLSIIEQGSLGALNASGRKAVSVVLAKALEMNFLIEQMLEAARLEEGRLNLKLELVDLSELASAAIDTVSPLADAQHPLILESGRDQVHAMADPSRVTTILTNLLDNAIKYSPAGGEIRCRVWEEDHRAFVSVQDRGMGIAQEDQPRLFSRFSRLISAETQHIPGTGLGLYLSRELARQLGGDIVLDSVPGKGSTFTLSLPGAAAPAESRPNPPSLTVLESTG